MKNEHIDIWSFLETTDPIVARKYAELIGILERPSPIMLDDIVNSPKEAMLLFISNPSEFSLEKTENGYDLWHGLVLYRQYRKGESEIHCFFEERRYPLDKKIIEIMNQ